MTKISLKFSILFFLLLSLIDVRLADDEEGGDEGGGEESGATEGGAKGGGGKPSSVEVKAVQAALQERYDKIKNDKSGKALQGNTGKVMHVVMEAIKEINPIRLIQEFDLDPLLAMNGVDVNKLKIPVSYLSNQFFDKFASKTKKSKGDLSKAFGVDVEAKKDGKLLSIGSLLKVGKESDLRLGDYIFCFGLDMAPYEKQYDDFLIEFIDEIATEGVTKYIKILSDYVSANGGAINAALKAYGDYTGKDVVSETQNAIKKLKSMNTTRSSGPPKHSKRREQFEKQMEEYKKAVNKQMQVIYNEWFGKGGRIFVYQAKMTEFIDKATKFLVSFYSGERLNTVLDLVGNTIGPEGRAISYIIYQPFAVMFNQIFGPLFLIPRILTSENDITMDNKVLALPPIIIQTTGSLLKPSLMIVEPLIRLARFLITGEYTNSLNAGLECAASYGISIWGGTYKPKPKSEKSETTAQKKTKKRPKREAPKKKEVNPEEASKYTTSDKKLIEKYQGGPPPGGYKLGVKNDGNFNLDHEDFISRVLLSPDFILKAGGPVFVPFASVLAPTLRIVNLVIFGKGDFHKRLEQVPEILKGVGLIGPLEEPVKALLPFIKMGHLIYIGKLSQSEVITKAPGMVKKLTSGILFEVVRNPQKLLKEMCSFLGGKGGIIAMLKFQLDAADLPKADSVGQAEAQHEFGEEANPIVRMMGKFFGGWLLGYTQALEQIVLLEAAFFNGILGNVIAPVKYLETDPNLKITPLKSLMESFDDLPRMLKSCASKKAFLNALLGGQDSDALNEIGISAEKLVENNIDPGKLLAGGKKLLDPEASKKLDSPESVGIDASKLGKISLDVKTLLESGLMDAKEEKLEEANIDVSPIINRVMRGSVEDESRLNSAGIEVRMMLKAGICPATLLVGGVHAIPEEKVKALGINANELSDEDLKKLGFNPTKLHSKGIDAKKLAKEGIESQAHHQGNMGINVEHLTTSVYMGLDPQRLLKAGVDVKAMVKAGVDPKLFLMGGIRKHTQKPLDQVGLNPSEINKMGVNLNLIADVGATVEYPVKLDKMGINPMTCLIATLSRHGLDTMTGGYGDPVSISFGFVNSLLRIINNMVGLVPRVRAIKGGQSIMAEDGRFAGPLGFILYNIIGIDNTGGILGFFQKAFSNKFTTSEILNLINPIRITNVLANPHEKPVKKRMRKDNHHGDEYISKTQKVAQNGGIKPRSNIFGNKEGGQHDGGQPTEGGEGAETSTKGSLMPSNPIKSNPISKSIPKLG